MSSVTSTIDDGLRSPMALCFGYSVTFDVSVIFKRLVLAIIARYSIETLLSAMHV